MKHYNPSIAADVNRILNTKGESLNDVHDVLIPVIPIVRHANIFKTSSKTTSGSATIYTTPSDKDFYLTSITFGLVKDATCDAVTGVKSITGFIDGISVSLAQIDTLVTTAQNLKYTQTFIPPLKIDRNTTIQIANNTYTAGLMVRSAELSGYTVETIANNTT